MFKGYDALPPEGFAARCGCHAGQDADKINEALRARREATHCARCGEEFGKKDEKHWLDGYGVICAPCRGFLQANALA